MKTPPRPLWKAALKGAAVGACVSAGIVAGGYLAAWVVVWWAGGEAKWGWPPIGVTSAVALVVPVIAGAAWGISRRNRV